MVTNHQHGFISARSTNTNLVSFNEVLVEGIDAHKQIDVIYTDFSKAFDRVSHTILIQKLSACGFAGPILKWLQSYLNDRAFYVVINGYRSLQKDITSGVPQGSHLGPILFNIFINDIPSCFLNSIPFLYADDLKFCRRIDSTADILLLQSDLDRLIKWCEKNGMTLNPLKCFHVKFSRKHNCLPSVYKISGECVQEVNTIKDLGVLYDGKLTFRPHIEFIIKKASKMLGFIIRNGKVFRNAKTKILLYNALVRSNLEYCSVVWRPHFAVHNLRLERVQKRFLWHLARSAGVAARYPSYGERLNYFNMHPLSKRRDLIDLQFLYKLFCNQIDCPQLLQKFYLRVPRRCPRYKTKLLCPPLRRTVLGINSPIPRLCKLYNDNEDLDIHSQSLACYRKCILDKFNM